MSLPPSLSNHSDSESLVGMYIFYTILLLLYQPIFVYFLITTYKILRREQHMPILDLFKLLQYYFFLGFLICRQAFFFLQYFPSFAFFYDPASFIIIFFLNGFEAVNLAWWAWFIAHLIKFGKDRKDYAVATRRVIYFEKAVFGSNVAAFVLSAMLILTANLTGLLAGCFFWWPYCTEEGCNSIWEFIKGDWRIIMYLIVSYFGLFQGFLKIVFGIIILILLKKNLNYYYLRRKWGIVCVISGTVLFLVFKFFLNLNIIIESNITDIFNERHYEKEKLDFWILLLTFSISLFNLILEIVLMKVNISNVDYKLDLAIIMKACNFSHFKSIKETTEISIFLIDNSHNSSFSYFLLNRKNTLNQETSQESSQEPSQESNDVRPPPDEESKNLLRGSFSESEDPPMNMYKSNYESGLLENYRLGARSENETDE
jgi:hypothetical protein